MTVVEFIKLPMLKSGLIFLLILAPLFSTAQILNVEKFRVDKDTSNAWAGNIGGGFNLKQQQTRVITLNANSNLVYLSRRHSYLNINNIKFVGVQSSDIISEGYTHWRVNLSRKTFVSYEPFVQAQYDLGRGLQERELAGFSFRFNLVRTPKTLIAFNSGAMYEHEVWKGTVLRYPEPSSPGYAETSFIKSTSNISVRGDVAPNVNVLLVTYYQARFEKFFRPRVISELQVNFVINKYFSISHQFTSLLDAMPILDNNEFTYNYNINLIVKF